MNSLVSLGMRAVFIVTGPVLGYMLDRHGMTNTLLGLAVIFAPLMLLVVMPLLARIKKEEGGKAMEAVAAN